MATSSNAAQAQAQIQESVTGQEAQPRPYNQVDPANLDPRFDKDDLRQGHPPPAAKKHLKLIKVRRNRKNKGTPYNPNEAETAADLEADLTDEEVEVPETSQDEPSSEKGNTGLIGKLLGKDKDGEKA